MIIETYFASLVVGNTPYVVVNNIENVFICIINIENASLTLLQWFYDNQMKVNPDNCYFICSTDDKVNIIVQIQKICSKTCEILLGDRFVSKFTFDEK